MIYNYSVPVLTPTADIRAGDELYALADTQYFVGPPPSKEKVLFRGMQVPQRKKQKS